MNEAFISTAKLSRSALAFEQSVTENANQHTCFTDLPLQARMLLAVPRIRGPQPKAPLAERYVLDALGRVIDAGPERCQTIDAVNILAEVLLIEQEQNDFAESYGQRLSAIENLVLCVLCKIRSGRADEAKELTMHWLNQSSFESFNSAAIALCNSDCIKRGGPHVFVPSWSGNLTVADTRTERQSSVSSVQNLSTGESLLLNAMRLRLRTLRHSGISIRVLPILRKHLALPRIEALVDGHLVESLQYSMESPDIRCLCCSSISIDEANFLSTFASYAAGDTDLIRRQLSAWLPSGSVERLMARDAEFKAIVSSLGADVPLREWDFSQLSDRHDHSEDCDHVNEPAMIH